MKRIRIPKDYVDTVFLVILLFPLFIFIAYSVKFLEELNLLLFMVRIIGSLLFMTIVYLMFIETSNILEKCYVLFIEYIVIVPILFVFNDIYWILLVSSLMSIIGFFVWLSTLGEEN